MVKHIHRFDTAINRWIISFFGRSAKSRFEAITLLGSPWVLLGIAIAIVGVGLYVLNNALVLSGMLIPATLMASAATKILIGRSRPISEYAKNMKTLSFPSGHSSGAVITYGLLAMILFTLADFPWNWVSLVLGGGIPLLIGISRVYLGAHFASDVLAGWLLGLAVLLYVIEFVRPLA